MPVGPTVMLRLGPLEHQGLSIANLVQLTVDRDRGRTREEDDDDIPLAVHVLAGAALRGPREQRRVQIVRLRAPDRAFAVRREQIDDRRASG